MKDGHLKTLKKDSMRETHNIAAQDWACQSYTQRMCACIDFLFATGLISREELALFKQRLSFLGIIWNTGSNKNANKN